MALTTKRRVLIHIPGFPRTLPLSDHTIWAQGGFSGTDTAVLEVGRALVASGRFEVTALGWWDKESYTDPDTGIHFAAALEPIAVNDFDWYCPLFADWFDHAEPFLRAIYDKRATKLLVWLHCTLRDDVSLHDWRLRRGFQVFGLAVSQWVLDLYTPHFEPGRLWLAPNGVAPRFFEAENGGGECIDSERNRGSWCFHACFGRGGAVALRVFEETRRRKPDAARVFHGMSYVGDIDAREYDAAAKCSAVVNWHGSLGKTQLATTLAHTEYFVYPLTTIDGAVVHDTFACTILEALSMGVIVVTWAVGSIPTTYGDLLVALQPPLGYPANNRIGPCEPWFISEEAVQQLAAAVIAIDADPERKAHLRRRGMEWARAQTWRIGADAMIRGMIPKPVTTSLEAPLATPVALGKMAKQKVYFTIFAGRKRYMRILQKYTDALLKAGSITEVHVWDFARNAADSGYLAALCQSAPGYRLFVPPAARVANSWPWAAYYAHYQQTCDYAQEDILIKCDDDVVFIDVSKFDRFIADVASSASTAENVGKLYFPNLVNNDVCAHIQSTHGVHDFATTVDQSRSTRGFTEPLTDLYKNPALAAGIHERFLANPAAFSLEGVENVHWQSRLSINMFATTFASAKMIFSIFKSIVGEGFIEDEGFLSASLCKILDRPNNVIVPYMNVVHFSFVAQDTLRLDAAFLPRYDALSNGHQL